MTVTEYHTVIDYLRKLIRGSEFEGRVYAVGGCVRDEAMCSKSIKDIDLAVEIPNGGLLFAEWLRKKRLTKGRPVTFPRYGTAMLRLRAFPHIEIEIVQTRSKKYTGLEDTRPEEFFGEVSLDCRMRDLTINALYKNISTGELVDPTGMALEDIRNQRLRTPDEPSKVFHDDPVRVLRAIRFSSTLGWPLPEEISCAIPDEIDGLKNVKVERMRQEIEKIMAGPDPCGGIERLETAGAMSNVFPELQKIFKDKDKDGTLKYHGLETLKNVIPLSTNPSVRFAALLHDLGKAYSPLITNKKGHTFQPDHDSKGAHIARRVMGRLRIDRGIVKDTVFLIAHHHFPDLNRITNHQAIKRLRKLQRECRTQDRFADLLALMQADGEAGGNTTLKLVNWLRSTSAKLAEEGKDGFAKPKEKLR